MSAEECRDFDYYGNCRHRDECECWCHKEEDES